MQTAQVSGYQAGCGRETSLFASTDNCGHVAGGNPRWGPDIQTHADSEQLRVCECDCWAIKCWQLLFL